MPVPVVVTGAETALGRAVLDALLAAGDGEVRATTPDRGAALALRASGVPTAVSDLSDPRTTGAVLEGAHTVVHLQETLGTWEWLREAAEDTGVRRVVAVLPAGTDVPAAPEWEVVVVAGDAAHAEPDVVRTVLAADRRR